MTAPDRTDRFFATALDFNEAAADRVAPVAFESPEPADAAPAYARKGRLQRWVGDLLQEPQGVRAKTLAAGGALLASGFHSNAPSSGPSDALTARCGMNRREHLLQAPVVRASLTVLAFLLMAMGATARAVARWGEVATSAALIAAAGTVCVFALFGQPERTYDIRPDSTPDAAPPPAITQPDGASIAQLGDRAHPSRSGRP